MAKRSARRRMWWFAALSALLHVGWYAAVRAPHRQDREPVDSWVEVSFETDPEVARSEPPQDPPLHPGPPPDRRPELEPSPPLPAAREREPRRRERETVPSERRSTRRGEREPPVADDVASTPAEPSPDVAAAAAASKGPLAPRPSQVDLSPRRAASSMIETFALARACAPSRADAGAGACEPESDVVETAERRLEETLGAAANAPAYRARREPPRLQRAPDGSYSYAGPVFAARIRQDGLVEFRDGPNATIDGPSTTGPGIRGGFDLTDAIEHGILGKERYSAEKRWFLEQTASLRAQLAEAARAEESAGARRALGHALDGILAARELTPAQKRQRVFELWESCGDDADSRETRRHVERFVRLRMPEGSALGFSREELERFNRGRGGLSAFEPYRAS